MHLDLNGLCESCSEIQKQREELAQIEIELMKKLAELKSLEHILIKTRIDPSIIVDDIDPRLNEAIEIVLNTGTASTTLLQRQMRIGYARAGRMIDAIERMGIISEANGSAPRRVLVSREQLREFLSDE